jgi:hypothetical protein
MQSVVEESLILRKRELGIALSETLDRICLSLVFRSHLRALAGSTC